MVSVPQNEKQKPLISVIVPIFNVEKYIRRCLDSLRGQTLKQIEVICIDDGSTDSSGVIAEDYVTEPGMWPKFRIIHHENNRGLSAARNTGIDAARSLWIMFVDSDDWVEPDFCRIPYKTAIEHSADMVIFQADTVKRGKVRKHKPYRGPVGIVDEMTAHEYGSVVIWNKLYKKELLENLCFPEGRVYEDIATTHKFVHKADRIELLSCILYHHLIRRGSILYTHTMENRRDCLISEIERMKDLDAYGYPVDKIKDSLCGLAIGYLTSTNDRCSELYKKAIEIVNSLDGIPESLSCKQKIALRAWRMNKNFFYILCRASGRMKKCSR